jgi:indolepyruvate ferredoxin oxidoreductase
MPKTLDERIAFRENHLRAYQGRRLAARYRKMLDRVARPRLREAVALGYHRVLAYKDEYEVARLLRSTREKAQQEFGGELKLTYHLAPPILTREGPDGRPQKRRFGAWIERFYPLLAAGRRLRGTWLDPFGRSGERRMERSLIRQYEADMAEVLGSATPRTRDAVVALAELPLQIRGFGPVKAANAAKAEKRREELLATIRAGGPEMAKAAE